MISMVFSNWNVLENGMYSKYIGMNAGYWHETVLGTSQKKTRLYANSAGFLVAHFLCCLALYRCSSISYCACSCPTAGRKAVLLPSPIKASPRAPQNLRKCWLFLSSWIQVMWNPGCLILTFTYIQELCIMYMEKNSNIISDTVWVAISCLFHDGTVTNDLGELKRVFFFFFPYEEFVCIVVEITGATFLIKFSSSCRKDVRGKVLQYKFPCILLMIIILLGLEGLPVGHWIPPPGSSVPCWNCYMPGYVCLLFFWWSHSCSI